MSGSLSNYAENQLARFLFCPDLAVTRPSARHVALHSAAPGENCAVGEMAALGRQAATFGAPASGQVSNTNSLAWTSSIKTTAVCWSVWDAAGAGNPLGWGTLLKSLSWAKVTLSTEKPDVSQPTTRTLGAGNFIIVARGLTSFAKALALNWLFRSAAVTRPAEIWMALHRMPPGDLGSSGELTSDGGARRKLAFTAPANGVAPCGDAIIFGPATAAWPRLTHYSLWDAPSAGNCLMTGALKTHYDVLSGGRLNFAAGDILVKVN